LGISYLKRLEWALKMKKRTVAEAINEHLWILDAPQASLIGELVEYLGLWDWSGGCTHLATISHGPYSEKSAYEHLLQGSTAMRMNLQWRSYSVRLGWATREKKIRVSRCSVTQ
jgi:hypothetical protein